MSASARLDFIGYTGVFFCYHQFLHINFGNVLILIEQRKHLICALCYIYLILPANIKETWGNHRGKCLWKTLIRDILVLMSKKNEEWTQRQAGEYMCWDSR